jgi:hypothetical protein
MFFAQGNAYSSTATFILRTYVHVGADNALPRHAVQSALRCRNGIEQANDRLSHNLSSEK